MSATLEGLDPSLGGSQWSPRDPPSPLSLRSLRAWLSFETTEGLKRGLQALSPLCSAPQLSQALLQVIYRPELLSEEASALHASFQSAHPRCSTYLPLCLPGPHSEGLRAWSSPERCEGCFFREGERCDGLSPLHRHLSGPSAQAELRLALRDSSVDALDDRGWFQGQPVAYWRPTEPLRAQIMSMITAFGCETFWDVGAGNGALGALLCPPRCTLVSVEPLEVYSLPERALKCHMSAQEALKATLSGALPTPDVLLISWPPPTCSFRALIERLSPKLVIRACDLAGFCGARQGHWALWWREGHAPQWWAPRDCQGGYDDLTPPAGYERLLSQEVESLYDTRRDPTHAARQGIVVVHGRKMP